MINLTNIFILLLLLIYPNLNLIVNLNWLNSLFVNLNISINFLSTFNHLFTRALIAIFIILTIYSKSYLVGSFNYPYFEYIYNIFFLSMFLLICSNNLITLLIS